MTGNNRATKKVKKRKPVPKVTKKMHGKMLCLFGGLAIILCILIGRLTYINYTSGEKYTKIVLSQQSYDSKTIYFQRGDIVDSKGTVLATNVDVYNLILDPSVINSKAIYLEPTITALVEFFGEYDAVDRESLSSLISTRRDAKYIALLKKIPYEKVVEFTEYMSDTTNHPNIVGVWFDKQYERVYPYNSLASSVIGFVSGDNVGTVGLEAYYNSTLNGINGRMYGYLNSDSDFEKTVISAQDGNTLVTTLDTNIQSIVESKIKEWNDAYANQWREGNGSAATGVIVMNPNNGEILAMANYPSFDLSNPRDLSSYYTEEELATMSDEDAYNKLNQVWTNYCVTNTYEPGSVQKPFTVATGLETGTIDDSMTFFCDGGEDFDSRIYCVKRDGHGTETVASALSDSCNDSLMQMSKLIGEKNFLDYQSIFGFGYKTTIDLPGEPNTSGLVYNINNITAIDLACNSFGQNYNCTMVEMVSAFASLINGGNLYKPHLVKRIEDSKGNTVSEIEPTVLKQTISKSTSDQIMEYLYPIVSQGGGAKYAKVDGYSMGGKTGTAEKYPRSEENYLVSFMGYAPAQNPEVLIYVVIDTPNWQKQDRSILAQNLGREIMEEILPYMNIYPDEEKTGAYADWGITGQDDVSNPTYGVHE